MSETNVKTVKKIKKVVSEPNFIGVDLGKNSDVGTCNGEVLPKVMKKVKKIVKEESTYYVHTCGYDYVVDTINASVVFSGTKDECDNWMKEHSIVQGLSYDEDENDEFDKNEVEFEDNYDSSVKTLSDDELFEMLNNSVEIESDKSELNIVDNKKIDNNLVVDYGKQIMFTKVTDLDPKLYEDFTIEKYKYKLGFYDFEIFGFTDYKGVKHSDWCVTFLEPMDNKLTTIVNDRRALLKYYTSHKDNFIYVGYNSRSYDVPIFKAILLGMDAKDVSNKLIVEGLKPFQISDKFKEIQIYNFDLLKLNTSLKLLEAFMGHDIEETSVPFDIARFLNQKEWDMTVHYNVHDVTETAEIMRRTSQEYFGHIGVIEMFKFPFEYINKTKAQLTAEVTKCKRPEQKRDDDWALWVVDTVKLDKYKFIADWYMSFRDDHDRDRIETYENGKFVPYKGKDAKKHGFYLYVNICGVPHVVSYGGLHGCPKEPLSIKKKGQVYHSDGASLYPTIMIQYELFTRNAQEPQKFKEVYERRLELKHRDDKESKKLSKVLKIVLNSQFGIQGDINSNAYDMRNCRMVCITGQLLMISLLEELEPYIKLIQTNTDGIVYTIQDESKNHDKVFEIIKGWEARSRIRMETDFIDWITQGQVNGYAFQFSNGEYERKGAYLKENSEIDNDLPIVNEAMFEHIAHGIDVADYINSCDDLIKFQKIVRVSSNYKFTLHNENKSYNKTYRVFASKNKTDTQIQKCKYEVGTLIQDKNGKFRKYQAEKFANTPEHCFIDNTNILGKKCSDYPNFDKQWYIDLAYDRLKDQFHIDCRPSIFDF